MMKTYCKTVPAALAAAAAMAIASGASADVLYSNGPVNGTFNAYNMAGGQAVENSFTLSSAAMVTGVNFGAWTASGATLQTLDWSIHAVEGDFSVDGAASITQGAVINVTPGGLEVRLDSFSFAPLNLSAGLYYLVLQNADDGNGGSVYWDINNGPSTAFLGPGSIPVADVLQPGSNSEAFDIIGTVASGPGPVPEPASWALMIAGFGLAGLAVRRRAATFGA